MRPSILALVLLVGCGPQASDPELTFDFVMSALLKDKIQSLQVTLIRDGRTLDCLKVQSGCVVTQVMRDRFIELRDASGAPQQALVVPVTLQAPATDTTTTQTVTVQGIPLGKDYAMVVEAISPANTLAGSSCNYLEPINAGANPTKLANPLTALKAPINCDPRLK